MRLDELKNDIPETPEFIHKMIQEEVNKMMKENKVLDIKKKARKPWTTSRVAAAAMVGIMATSTVAFAGSKIIKMHTEKDGKYSVQTGVTTPTDAANYSVPAQVAGVTYQANYIPEGMVWNDENKISYKETPYEGGFSVFDVILDSKDMGAVAKDKNVIAYENVNLGGRDAVYIEYNDDVKDKSFNQKIYMFCEEQYRMVVIYVGDDVTKEDALKFAENLELIDGDTMLDTSEMQTWSMYNGMDDDFKTEGLESVDSSDVVSSKDVIIRQIGDTFDLGNVNATVDGLCDSQDYGVTVTVDSVTVYDDLSALDEAKIPDDWKSNIDENGKLKADELTYYKSGDGVNTLDSKVDTKTVNQKLVVAKVTYTNTSDKELNDVLFMGGIMLIDEENGTMTPYDEYATANENYDYVKSTGCARAAEMKYFDVNYAANGNGSNYIKSLKAGESITITMAWVVNENTLDDMYLSLDGEAGYYQFNTFSAETGIVDICQ